MKQIHVVVKADHEPGPLDCQSDALTTRPRWLHSHRNKQISMSIKTTKTGTVASNAFAYASDSTHSLNERVRRFLCLCMLLYPHGPY